MIKDTYMRKKHKNQRIREEEIAMIKRYLLGPFEPEWYDDEGVLDNSTPKIAEVLGITENMVDKYSSEILDKHFNNIGNDSKHQPNK
jgi:hypothetical protein